MKGKIQLFLWASFMILLSACSSGSGDVPEPTPTPTPTPTPVEKKIAISLNCGVSSRVTDANYENGDKIGLYVVNHTASGAGTLQSSGNHINNVSFTYNGSAWSSASPVYWKDATTQADFYVYYPYATVTNVANHAFRVKDNQSTAAAYKVSEFLYGTAKKLTPTSNAVSITTYHSMSCAVIKLAAGDGFTDEDLADANIALELHGLKTEASINLSTGKVSPAGDVQTIVPLNDNGQYKAIVVPQTVSAEDFIVVKIDGETYTMPKENFTFVGGKRHTFTVTVSKTDAGLNVNIGSWEEDDVDNGGTAE